MTIPPVASWIARSGGEPSRPASAVTTPVTVTLAPTVTARADAIGIAVGVGEGVCDGVGDGVGEGAGVRDGPGVGVGVGVGDGDEPGVALGAGDGDAVGTVVGAGVAVGSGVGPGVAEGLGVGAGRTASSPSSVAWIRYAEVPAPELSCWPTGPIATTFVPDGIEAPARAIGPTMTRTGPDPSSTRMPSPSAYAVGDPTVSPDTCTRRPSTGSAMERIWVMGKIPVVTIWYLLVDI